MNRIKKFIKNRLNRFISNSSSLKENNNLLLKHIDYLVNSSQKKKKVIYTCITGNYVDLQLHEYIDSEWDYVCFTDNEQLLEYKQYGVWKIRPVVFTELDNTLNNRLHKTHPDVLFPDYDESIYIDGNMNIVSSYVFDCVNKTEKNLIIPKHWKDDCVYEEIQNVINVIVPDGGEKIENVMKMKDFLEKENFPHHYGLNENNFIYRKHNEKTVIKIMNEWWNFIKNYTKRDQLSLSYVLYKNSIKPSDIQIDNLRTKPSAVRMICHKK